MTSQVCPYCHDQTRKLTRAKYLFRADVRLMSDDTGVVTDKSIPVHFCPACGKKLPDTNQPDKPADAIQ